MEITGKFFYLSIDERFALGNLDLEMYPLRAAEDVYYRALNRYDAGRTDDELETIERLLHELGRLCQLDTLDTVQMAPEASSCHDLTCPALSYKPLINREAVRRREYAPSDGIRPDFA